MISRGCKSRFFHQQAGSLLLLSFQEPPVFAPRRIYDNAPGSLLPAPFNITFIHLFCRNFFFAFRQMIPPLLIPIILS